jgi:hypothetical protein
MLLLGALPETAAAGGVVVEAGIDGVQLASASGSHPVRLDPGRAATISLRVRNGGRSPIAVSTVDFSGAVIGLTFFDYQTSVQLSVQPGQAGEVQFPLDLSGLDGQATGLMPAAMTLLDRSHHRLARTGTVVDVRGSLLSVYGLFGLAVALLTAAILASLLLALARHRLPDNRWRGAVRFVPLGVGVALFAAFTLSAARLFVPTVAAVVPILAVAMAVTFGLGYLAPAQGRAADPEPAVADAVDVERGSQPEAMVAEHETVGLRAAPRTRGPRAPTEPGTRGTGTGAGGTAATGTRRAARSPSTRSTRRTPPP